MKEGTKSEILRPMILSLRSLENLSNLLLFFPKTETWKLPASLLSLLGNACPLLTKLHVGGGGVFSKKEICGLLMGESTYDELSRGTEEPKWLGDSSFSRWKVPEKYLSPICCTLRKLTLFYGVPSSSSTSKIYGSSAIFILRHLSLLEKLHLPLSTAVAVKGFHEQTSFQLEFERDCQEAFLWKVEEQGPSHPNSESSFLGSLSLTSIDCVDTCRRKMAILLMILYRPDELQTYLNEWPKLTTISLEGFQTEYVASFLKVFGANLFQLRLSRCKFSVRQLLSCPKLEILRIEISCTLMDDSNDGMDTPLNQSTFLPQVKELHSDICLGSSWYLLENLSTLKTLHLSCCHISCKKKGSEDRPIAVGTISQSDWYGVPEMWPRLQHLTIDSCAGLTFAMLFNLAPRLPKLKRIWLPYEICEPVYGINYHNRTLVLNFFSVVTQAREGVLISRAIRNVGKRKKLIRNIFLFFVGILLHLFSNNSLKFE